MARNFTIVLLFIVIASYQFRNASSARYNDLSMENHIRARLYVPSTYSNQKLPLVVYYHGGAFTSGSTTYYGYDTFVQSLVDHSNVIALSIDYQLASYPEYVSASYRDSWTALEYVGSHSNGTGPNPILNKADFGRVFLVGDSAGANIAHNMAMRIGSDRINGLRIKGIALFCPYFWGATPIGLEPIDFFGRSVESRSWEIASHSSNLDDPRINPLVDPKLPTLGASEVLVITGVFDPLVFRGYYYAQALNSNGYKGKVYYESYDIGHDQFIFLPYLLGYSNVVNRAASFFNSA